MDEVLTVTIPDVLELKVLGNIGRNQRLYRDRILDSYKGNDAVELEGPHYCLSEVGSISLRNDVFDAQGPQTISFNTKEDFVNGKRALPVFFESRYIFRAKCHGSVKHVSVYHRLKSVVDGFTFADGWLFGDIDFINTPGRFTLALDITFDNNTTRRVKFSFVVVSVKMDVERDYTEILKKIEKERRGLVQNFLAKTFGNTGFDADGAKNKPVWYAILESVLEFYIGACKKIINDPHRRYESVAEARKADQIKKWSPQLANRFASVPRDRRELSWFRIDRIEAKTDTQENRFVLHTLRDIAKQLRLFALDYQSVDGISSECIKGVEDQAKLLDQLAYNPFFKGVGRYTGGGAQSLVLQKRPGYAQILTIWVKLKQALSPNGKGLDIGYRPLSALYEFWTFLAIRDILRGEKWKEGPIGADGVLQGYAVSEDPRIDDLKGLLASDDEAKSSGEETLCRMGYKFTFGSRTVSLAYQQTYGTGDGSDTFANVYDQRPDIVLSISDCENGKANVYTYLFDAKYRVDELGGRDASPRDAIDDMHRYRDAILYRRQQAGLSREVIGAYVLYPGRPYGHSYDYATMMATENIGAFPLLPGRTEVLEKFLKNTLAKIDPVSHLGNATSVRGTTVVVGEAYGESNIFDLNVANNEWDKWFASTRMSAEISPQDLLVAGKDPAAIKCIRLHNPNKPIATLEVMLHASPPDGVGTYSYNILRQSVAER